MKVTTMTRMSSIARVLLLTALVAGVASALAASPAATEVRGSATAGLSARMDKTSFTAAQSYLVKVTFHAPADTPVGYQVTLKHGANWLTVRKVADIGVMVGGDGIRLVGQLLPPQATVKSGRYRLKLFSAASSVTLPFTILKAPTVIPGEATPRAGHWTGYPTGGPSGYEPVMFTATADHRHVVKFSWKYGLQEPILRDPYYRSCYIPGIAVKFAATPIAHKSFKSSGSSGSGGIFSFSGTFDSPLRAHGTVEVENVPAPLECGGLASSAGTLAWTATWEKAR
jgi:hypothetical protein